MANTACNIIKQKIARVHRDSPNYKVCIYIYFILLIAILLTTRETIHISYCILLLLFFS